MQRQLIVTKQDLEIGDGKWYDLGRIMEGDVTGLYSTDVQWVEIPLHLRKSVINLATRLAEGKAV